MGIRLRSVTRVFEGRDDIWAPEENAMRDEATDGK